MAFWKKNPNEALYVEGKKHWTDVIKNTGDPSLLIWKQPEEDFNTNSTLIVMPGESAILVHNGTIEQVFTSGSYKLSTENYPFISRLRNQFSGGISVFNCVVYFVKQADTKELRWGLPTPIQVRDPVHGIATKLQVRGSYKVSIANPEKFLFHMVGSRRDSLSEDGLKEFFVNEMQMNIRSLIGQFVKSSNAEILGICEYQMEIAYLISPYIAKVLEPYGLRLISFTIAALDIPEDDPNRMQLEDAYAKLGSLKILGEDWARLRSAEILEKLAENPGAGGTASMGAGIGMSMAAAPVFANLAQQMFGGASGGLNMGPSTPYPNKPEDKPASMGAGTRFGTSLGQDSTPPSTDSFQESIKKLQTLRDMGAITEQQFNDKIQEIMSRL